MTESRSFNWSLVWAALWVALLAGLANSVVWQGEREHQPLVAASSEEVPLLTMQRGYDEKITVTEYVPDPKHPGEWKSSKRYEISIPQDFLDMMRPR